MDAEKAALVKKKVSDGAKRPMSDETKKKLSNTQKGKKLGPMTDEHKKSLSIAKGTPITINGITYHSINHASAMLGLPKYKIKQLGLSSTEPW
jgi:hypothetical protein